MGIGDKVSGAALFCDVWDTVLTFRAPREVHVRHKGLAALYWLLAGGTLTYVVVSIFVGYQYLTTIDPVAVVGGYGEMGTMYTGVTSVPKYCAAPYTNDYVQPGSTDWQYINVGCARYPMTDVMLKRAPAFQFFTTLMYERTYTMSSCSTSTTCNSDTAGVNQVGDSCMCTSYATKYVLNPEGMNLVLLHDVTANFESGNSYEGASRQANEKTIKTVLMDSDGKVVLTWNTPDEIKIKVSKLLELAALDLDTLNTNEEAYNETGSQPYWRMTGATLVLDMEYRNYDVPGEDAFYSGHDDMIYCILTVSHLGSWESIGSESVDFEQPIRYNQEGSSNVYSYDTQVVDRYRQGLKVVLKPHGSMGEVDEFAVINSLINGIVLLSVATMITTTVAKYFMCGGFSGIFRNYQDVEVKPGHVITRTASTAAAQASLFMRAFDRGGTGFLSQRMLFENIKLLCGEDLTDLQIAQLVGDICSTSDIDRDGKVAVDEFTHFLSPDECDLMNVIEQYQGKEGDQERLDLIQDQTLDPEYEKQIKGMQAGVHEVAVAAAAHGEQRHVYAHYWQPPLPPPPPQTRIVPARFCTTCGQSFNPGQSFCTACGVQQARQQMPVPQQQMAVPQQQMAVPQIVHRVPGPPQPTAPGYRIPPPPNNY